MNLEREKVKSFCDFTLNNETKKASNFYFIAVLKGFVDY